MCVPPSWASFPPPPPTPLLWVIAEHRAELPALYSSFSHLTHGRAQMSVPLSQSAHLPRPLLAHKSALYVCHSIPALKQAHLYHVSRFHEYVLIHDVSFFLTYFTLYNRASVHPPQFNWLMFRNPYLTEPGGEGDRQLCAIYTLGPY